MGMETRCQLKGESLTYTVHFWQGPMLLRLIMWPLDLEVDD